ncbi:hypothetical protein NX801_08835 [Streptomyces sp. LP05-1]|uniref:Gametolysin peptidase M11 n=1 Tax=Streptomyces pyxinae TaxID=2970734 RepID=A0ABT2CED6_9ACTN|nr:hypothetical protein [Streptomyces sp. LP05-1]MCS0635767.1 hypothetical protein [Streptomyces sp. LP05-1]
MKPRTPRNHPRLPAVSRESGEFRPATAVRRPRAGRRGTASLLAVAALVLSAVWPGTASAAPTAPGPADQPETLVDRHAVVLVNFRNLSLDDAGLAHERAARNFFGATDSLASYYARNSGGRMSVVPARGDGVFGPFTLDMDDTAACDTGRMAELAREAMAGVAYDHISLVLTSRYCGNWWGLAHQPGKVSWFHEGAVDDKAAIYHEIGHNLGFAHQPRQKCAPGSYTSCEDDDYSKRTPMGAGGDKKGLSAPELLSRHWLTARRTATPDSAGTVRLRPLHASGDGGTRALDLPLGTGGDRVVVEYRTPDPATPDAGIARGVNVYRVPGGQYNKATLISNVGHDADTPTGSFGGTFTDTSAGLSLSVVTADAEGAEVRVGTGTGAGPATSSAGPAPTTARPTAAAPAAPSPAPTARASAGSAPGADEHAAIGTTAPGPGGAPDGSAPTAARTAAADDDLASTGAAVAGPALAGLALVVAGGVTVFVLRRRRPARHGR